MQTILLTLCSAVIVSVLCDVMVSGGSIKKYAKLAIGISVSIILVIPIVNFLDDATAQDYQTIAIDEGYISIIDSQYITVICQTVELKLQEMGIVADVECGVENGEISYVIATSAGVTTKEKAEEVGFAIVEILSVPLSKVVVRNS